MTAKRFDPTQITTSRILSGDDTVQAVKLQGQTKTFRRSLTLKPILGYEGGREACWRPNNSLPQPMIDTEYQTFLRLLNAALDATSKPN